MLIDSPSSQEVLPPPSRLDAVVATLWGSRDHRNLIGFVERWTQVQTPSPAARLAQARAFLALGQVDRAWVRLRQLVESEAPSLDAIKVTTELFLVRGWPARARDLLQLALKDHPDDRELQALWDRSSTPSPLPPALSRAEVDALPVDDLVDQALHQLAQGRTTSARGMLERAARAGVQDGRVDDLLWAIHGELLPAASLAELTDRWTPVDHTLGTLASEDENTESITQEEVRRILADVEETTGESGFPTLFRGQEAEELDDEVTEEVTSTVARIEASHLDAPTQPDLDDDFDDEEGDTRIVRVLNRKGLPLHTNHAEPDDSFDLDEYRSEMGMPVAAHLGMFGAELEEEDDDLVVLTHREPIQLPTPEQIAADDPTMSQIGREVAHLLGGRPAPTPPPPVGPADPSVSSGAPATPRERAPVDDSDPAVGVLDDDALELVPRRKRQVRRTTNLLVWLGVGALLVAGVAVGLGAFLVGWLLG